MRRTQAYREQVLPRAVEARVAIEAAAPETWWRYVGPRGAVVGMTTFGASGVAKDLFKHFGFTVENVVSVAQRCSSGGDCESLQQTRTAVVESSLRGNQNAHQSRNQRLRPHRSQHAARAVRGEPPEGNPDRRAQRPGRRADQRVPDALRHACTASSGARCRSTAIRMVVNGDRIKRAGRARPGEAAVGPARRRLRVRVHGSVHQQGEGRRAPDRRREEGRDLGAG